MTGDATPLLPAPLPFLPPRGYRTRWLAIALMIAAPLAFGALALFLGQDANWDLRNYHWYNAYAFLNHRFGFDLLPSQTPYFYNPIIDVPFYLMGTHASARFTAYILGCVQGCNYILLFMLAHATLIIPNARHKLIVCISLALLGMLGGGGIAMLGTVFYDNVTSLGLFASALLVLRFYEPIMLIKLPRAFGLALLCGIPAGLMMGLKLPSVIFCVGLCFALLCVGGSWQRRFLASFAFGCGVLIGFAVTYGYWGWFLESHFGNPFFPYFNQYFKAPLAPLDSARDTAFVTRSFFDAIFFPFIFADSPYRVGEIPWRDWRIPILYVLLPLAVIIRLSFGRTRQHPATLAVPFAARYLLWAAVLTYAAWLAMFCIYRYAIPLEMLTPLLIVLSVGLLPVKNQTRAMFAGFILLVIALSIQPGNWSRRSAWLDHTVEADIPPLPENANLMILMAGFEPYSHLLPLFPPDIPFVRIQSNFSSPDQDKRINAVIHNIVDNHKGQFKILIPPWQKIVAEETLAHFRLAMVWEACQTVRDRLYDDQPLALCPVVRQLR
jgi:hypothetical protein